MFKRILVLFLTWRVSLFAVAFLATLVVPVFGNRFPYAGQVLKVTGLPAWVWGFGNFDGVHYLRIAQNGYDAQYSQAFFPLYPLIIRGIAELNLFTRIDPAIEKRIYVDPSYFTAGLILSNAFFLLSLVFFYKLIRIDFKPEIAFGSLLLLLFFPTSFYFGAIYTESLFLFLVTAALYFARKGNFIAAGILSLLASATRVFGLLLIPVLFIEIYLKIKKGDINFSGSEFTKAIIGLLLAPFGALLYMLYLKLNFENPLYFLTSQSSFGAERTADSLVLLPQVIYRYLKMFATVPVSSPLFLNAILEFSLTIVAFVCLTVFVKKMRKSYLVFTFGSLILPTLTGTFSSMPRYLLMGFLLLPFITQAGKQFFKLLLAFFIVIEIILISVFIRGYWVA